MAISLIVKSGFELGYFIHLLTLFPGLAGLSKLRRVTRMDAGLSKLFIALMIIPGVAQIAVGILLFRIHEVRKEGLPPEPVAPARPEPVAAAIAQPVVTPRPAKIQTKIKVNLAVLPTEMTILATSRHLALAALLTSVATLLAFAKAPGFEALRGWWPLQHLTAIVLGGAALQKHHLGKPLHALLRALLALSLVLPLLNLMTPVFLWLRATLTLRRAAREQARLNPSPDNTAPGAA